MNALFAIGMPSMQELIIIFLVILLLFGAKKLPELAKGMGQAIREFKKASKEATDSIQSSIEEDTKKTPPPPSSPKDDGEKDN